MSRSILIADLLISKDATLHQAMQKIDLNESGIAFVTESAGNLVGVLTDGDIRRALLKGSGTESLVSAAMTAQCVSLPINTRRDDILGYLMRNPQVRMIPLVNENQHPVDYASLRSLHRIPIANPDLTGNEFEYVASCLRDGWISSQGPFVRRFEAEFAEFVGVRDAVSTSSGTTALHLALEGLGIGPGDEVIVPDFTFAASINAIIYCGATPVIIDVDRRTWNLNPDLLEAALTPRTKAVMVVHLYGQPARMDSILEFTERNGLFLVEDAAEALGCSYGGQNIGSIGHVAAFSFFGNKLITTGEGGMVIAKSPAVTERIRILRDHGMDPKRRYWHGVVGYNYRMTNLQAALGVAQLERIHEFIGKKKHIGERYESLLGDIPGIVFPIQESQAGSVCWLFSVATDPEITGVSRDNLILRLAELGIETRPVFYPLHRMPPYLSFTGGRLFPSSDWLSDCGLSLPSAVNMPDAEIDYIGAIIRRIVNEFAPVG